MRAPAHCIDGVQASSSDQRVELGIRDDERRRQQHMVAVAAVDRAAHRIDHQAAAIASRLDARMQLQRRVEGRLAWRGRAPARSPWNRPAAADVAHVRVRAEGGLQALAQARALRAAPASSRRSRWITRCTASAAAQATGWPR